MPLETIKQIAEGNKKNKKKKKKKREWVGGTQSHKAEPKSKQKKGKKQKGNFFFYGISHIKLGKHRKRFNRPKRRTPERQTDLFQDKRRKWDQRNLVTQLHS